ncbi:MAG: ankyrin repeat domain-containing protein [Candidatus Dependentiae bacterium]
MNTCRTFLITSLLVLSSGVHAASFDALSMKDLNRKKVIRHRAANKKFKNAQQKEWEDRYNKDTKRYKSFFRNERLNRFVGLNNAAVLRDLFEKDKTNASINRQDGHEVDHETGKYLKQSNDSYKKKKKNKKKKKKSPKNNSAKKKSPKKSNQQQQRSKKSNFQQQRSNVAPNKIKVEKIASMSIEERTAKLHKIIKYRNDDYCCQLLEAGVDASVVNKKGKTVLYKAVARRKYDFIEKLLQKGADSSIATNQGYTPLHKAVVRDSIESVKLLLQFKANPSVVNEDGDTPLHIAVINDCFECASELVKAGSDLLLANKKGLTPLGIAHQINNKAMILLLNEHSSSGNNIPAAAVPSSSRNKKTTKTAESRLLLMQKDELSLLKASKRNDTKTVRKLLNMHVDPNCPTVTKKDKKAYGGSPLCNAVEHGNVELVEALLNVKFNKADPNVLCERYKNDNPDTPLRIAVRQRTKSADYPAIIRLLVKSGADINYGGQSEEYSRKSHTPLMIHAYQDNPRMDIFDALLECGADVNKQDHFGNTALHIAAERNHIVYARKLLEAGANVLLANKDGNTPLHLAVEKGCVDFVKQLLEFKADITIINNKGLTPLDMALKSKNKDMISVLKDHAKCEAADASGSSMKKKEGFSVVDENGNTDLHLAMARINKYAIELLKTKVSADVSIVNNDGDTPLHLAVKRERSRLVRKLLKAGADASIKNKNGETPEDVAPSDRIKVLFKKKTPKRKKNKKHLLESKADMVTINNEFISLLWIPNEDLSSDELKGETADASAKEALNASGPSIKKKEGSSVVDENGNTDLHFAMNRTNAYVVELLKNKAKADDISIVNNDGNTPLHLAAKNGRTGLVRALLKAGAIISIQNNDGDTPLHLAVKRGRVGLVRKLLVKGADASIKNKKNETPIDLVSSDKMKDLFEKKTSKCKKNKKHLLESKADMVTINNEDLSSDELKCEAADASGPSMENKEEPLVVDENGNTDLHLAMARINKYAIELLKTKVSADVSIVNNDGDTPLHLAVKKRRIVLVRKLLKAGADASIKNKNGERPLDVASSDKIKDLFKKKTPKWKKKTSKWKKNKKQD